MFIKFINNRPVKHPKKILKILATFLLITSWILTGYPAFWLPEKNGKSVKFPPHINKVLAASSGPLQPSTCVDATGIGTVTWTNPGNTVSSNDVYATASLDGTISHYIKCTGYSFNIPAGNVIEGIVVGVERKSNSTGNGGSKDAAMRIVKGGTIGSTDLSTATIYTTGDVLENHGSSTELWGETWGTTDINSSTFGAAFAATKASSGGAAHTVSVDDIQITVYYSPPTTTLGADSANDPAAATVAPGSGIRSAGQFTFTTSSGTDTIPDLTLTLGGSPAGSYAAIDSVSVRASSCAGTLYFSAVAPTGDSVSFSGGTALSASTGGNTYLICVTPKDHTLASGTYSVSPYISSTWTSGNGNTKAGSDTNANALTIDNTAPNSATSYSGTAGNTSNTLNWTTSSSSDFNTTSGSVVYRWQSGSAGSEVPAEGSTPSTGDTNSTATVACVISSAASSAQSKVDGTGGSAGCTTTALTNGLQYIYKVFQKDNYGNYDSGVTIGPLTPTAASASFTQNKYRWYYDNDLINPVTAWGAPVLAENTAIGVIPAGKDPPDTTQELRLRVNLVVNTANLSALEKYFKLEYKAGTDGSCTSGTWTDVGTGVWTYATSGVGNGGNITASLSDTTSGKGEQYVKGKPSALNNVGANTSEIIEYDFHIIGGTATPNTTYSFRVVGTNDTGGTETVLDAYTNCPTLITEPGTADLMRHGQVFTNAVKQGFFWAN